MTTTAIIMKEIESMPEESAVEVLDFALFLKSKQISAHPKQRIAIKDAYGIFKEINTHFERDESDRI